MGCAYGKRLMHRAAVDVVQGIRTGPVEQTGRGVIIVGVTTKVVSVDCEFLFAPENSPLIISYHT